MQMNRWKILLISLLTLSIIVIAFFFKFKFEVATQLENKKFLIPTEFFSHPLVLKKGQIQPVLSIKKILKESRYKPVLFGQRLLPGQYSVGQAEQCLKFARFPRGLGRCIALRRQNQDDFWVATFSDWDEVIEIYSGEDMIPAQELTLDPIPFAQFIGGKPSFQISVELKDIPRFCVDALLAIEDPHFLEHNGLSPRAILRAVWANIRYGFGAQGGSTLTQQLVKNYFLSAEKTVRRKLNEMFLSLALESQASKDQILEKYMNIVYLGQYKHLSVRGWGSAAQYYFDKPVDQLNLGECASIAALLNNPGNLNPWRNKEAFQKRKNKVLEKMWVQKRISTEQKNQGLLFTPTKVSNTTKPSTAPYFLNAVYDFLKKQDITIAGGAKIYTTLNLYQQKMAEEAVSSQLPKIQARLDKNHKHRVANSPANKDENPEIKKPLEVALISASTETGAITTLIGGRQFVSSPYNRALQTRRPVGSLIKPLVFLNGMLQKNEKGQSLYSPLSPVDNSPFTHKYEGQAWTPRNYDRKFSAPVPYFYALKESLNIPTARVAIAGKISKLAKLIESLVQNFDVKPLPSISLGVSEMSSYQVLEIYNTLANMGLKKNLHMVKKVVSPDGDILFEYQPSEQRVFPKEQGALLISMMKEVMKSGTGRSAARQGFIHHAAGKTGTTSKGKDAWFAGFSAKEVAVVWTGRDENTETTLAGSSGALPIWTEYMKSSHQHRTNDDFPWPESLTQITIPTFELEEWKLPENKLAPVDLWLLTDEHQDEFDDEY